MQPGIDDRICVSCGRTVRSDRTWLCDKCGQPFLPRSDPYEALLADAPATLVRAYKGVQQADANAIFQDDAKALAERGYLPTTQSWAPGQWGCGAFLVATLLCFLIIGLFVFLYLLIVKPEGTLTVTYAKSDEAPQAPTDAKVCPRCAETIKAAAVVCRYCGHEFDEPVR